MVCVIFINIFYWYWFIARYVGSNIKNKQTTGTIVSQCQICYASVLAQGKSRVITFDNSRVGAGIRDNTQVS